MRNVILFILLVLGISCAQPKIPADYLIENARIIDGSGAESFMGDVVIRGDSILFVGAEHDYIGTQTIDGSGMVLTPGFIDPHAHGDPFKTPSFENFIHQGVTTICLGQDGSSVATRDMEEWFNNVDTLELGVNVATLIGHGTIRRLANIEADQIPSTEQQLVMEQLLAKGIKSGAFGMSTGLEYVPGYYAKEQELIDLAKIVGGLNGLIMSHNRNEDEDAVDESVRELIRQGAYTRVQVSHLKVVFGKGQERAKQLLNIIDSARNAGIEIFADIYPYNASYTGIGIVFPDYAKPPNDYAKVVETRREDLTRFLIDKVNFRNGPESTLFGTGKYAGKTLKELSDAAGLHFADYLIDTIGPGGASAAYFVMDDELQERLITGENMMVCTDGSPSMRHPRGYGSFAKIIAEYVNEKELFDLEIAIHKMTGLPAKSIGLHDRGIIEAGKKADLLLFDPDQISAPADFENPYQTSKGFDWIMVNGQIAKVGEELHVLAGTSVKKTN